MKACAVIPLVAFALSPPAIAGGAETVMSPAQFRAYAENQTLYFEQSGKPYGAEQYLPGDRSIWRYADGSCSKGVWHARGMQICFVYEGESDEQCWLFLKKPDGIAARAMGREPVEDLTVIWKDTSPLRCSAPDVGS